MNLVKLYNYQSGKYLVRYINKSYVFEFNKHVLRCDLYNSLKRGPNQKVISFSLFGKSTRYYDFINEIVDKVKIFYPDHLVRIYDDGSLEKSFMCDLECKEGYVDFCNIKKLPIDIEKNVTVLNVDFLNSRMWRFLAVGDTFVDLFHSRDSDSLIFQRG
ncbi:unnamed protein product [Brachionus calyciflorus]|uniref:Uncharacterized protein n=1 Tax=Brachionus calyciflorus TaxID=104777 RepID=A0A814QZF2_9BILA|nr:unnamed protein product [Brachionus calyciflorus]